MDTDNAEEQPEFGKLMRLAEFRNARIANRRIHEWTVTLALWGLLAAGIKYPPPASQLALELFPLILIALVIGHALLWVRTHYRESRFDTLISFYYLDRAERPLTKDDPDHRAKPNQPWPKEHDLCFIENAQCWAQMMTTAILALLVYLSFLQHRS